MNRKKIMCVLVGLLLSEPFLGKCGEGKKKVKKGFTYMKWGNIKRGTFLIFLLMLLIVHVAV